MDNSLLASECAQSGSRPCVGSTCGTSLKKVFHRVREGGVPVCVVVGVGGEGG